MTTSERDLSGGKLVLYALQQESNSKQKITSSSVTLHYTERQVVKHLSMVLLENVSVSETQEQQRSWRVLEITDVNI